MKINKLYLRSFTAGDYSKDFHDQLRMNLLGFRVKTVLVRRTELSDVAEAMQLSTFKATLLYLYRNKGVFLTF